MDFDDGVGVVLGAGTFDHGIEGVIRYLFNFIEAAGVVMALKDGEYIFGLLENLPNQGGVGDIDVADAVEELVGKTNNAAGGRGQLLF